MINYLNLDKEAWKKIFYRVVDTLKGEDGDLVRGIEEDLFLRFVKADVENESGPWIGSSDQNKLSNMKVSFIIKNSFKYYESIRQSPQEKVFDF